MRAFAGLAMSGLMVMAAFSPAAAEVRIKPVEGLDLSRYLGKWYEIARMPFAFEDGMDNVTATYSLKQDGNVNVLNEGFKNGKKESAVGTAWLVDRNVPAKLKVAFFLWFGAEYVVFALDKKEYQWALVGSGDSLFWVLSRNRTMDEALFNSLVKQAWDAGYDTNRMIRVKQD